MSIFSEKLKEYIEKSGVSIYFLAKKAGVNRTMIHKSLKGDRIPSDDFIDSIADVLMLSNREIREIKSLAERMRIGEKRYRERQAVLKAINHLCVEFDDIHYITSTCENEVQNSAINRGYTIIERSTDVKKRLCTMLQNAKRSKEASKIILYLPSHAEAFYRIIYKIWVDDAENKIKLLHFLGLEKEYFNTKATVNSIQQISYMLSFCFCHNDNYRAMYYYLDYPINVDSLEMPYYVKTPDSVLAISHTLNEAIYYDSPEMIDYYDRKISERQQTAREFIHYEADPMKMLENKYTYTIEAIPNLCSMVSPDLVEAVIREDLPQYEAVVARVKNYYCCSKKSNLPISCFQIEELRQFIKTGIIPIIPRNIVRPMMLNERIAIIQEVFNEIKNSDEVSYYAIDPQKIRIDGEVELVLTQNEEIIIRRLNEDKKTIMSIKLKEKSTTNAFKDFIQMLPANEFVLTKEEMVREIENILKEVEL